MAHIYIYIYMHEKHQTKKKVKRSTLLKSEFEVHLEKERLNTTPIT